MNIQPVPPYDEFKTGIEATIKELRGTLRLALKGVYEGEPPLLQSINLSAIQTQLDLLHKQINSLGSAYVTATTSNAELVAQRDEIRAQFELLRGLLDDGRGDSGENRAKE